MELTDYFVHIGDKNINRTPCSQEKKAYNHLYLKAPINKQGKDLTVWFSEYWDKNLLSHLLPGYKTYYLTIKYQFKRP